MQIYGICPLYKTEKQICIKKETLLLLLLVHKTRSTNIQLDLIIYIQNLDYLLLQSIKKIFY